MKVLELLEELTDEINAAGNVPLTGKIMVDPAVFLEIIRDIRSALPEDIEQAKWVNTEKDRILGEARKEYETVVSEAERRAEELINEHEIYVQAQKRASDLMESTEANIKQLKMNTYGYIDNMLYDFQEKMDMLNVKYFAEMFENLGKTFDNINETLTENREEIKDMAYSTKNDIDRDEREI